MAAGGFQIAPGEFFQPGGLECEKELAPVDHVSWWRWEWKEPLPWKAAAPFTSAGIGGGILREETDFTDRLGGYLDAAIMRPD
jgi:hypothetical protein